MKKEEEEVRFIYTLSHPTTKEIRYIGQTKNIKQRLAGHIYDSKKGQLYTNRWINSLIDKGLKPVIEVLEECTVEDVDDNEILYISLLKSWGFRLTNSESGGNRQKTMSIESRKKMSIARKLRVTTEETRAKYSSERKGRKLKPRRQEHINKVASAKSTILFDTQTGIYYSSIKEAAQTLNINVSTLQKSLQGKFKNRTNLIYI